MAESGNTNDVTIFSDCLNVVQALDGSNSKRVTHLMNTIKDEALHLQHRNGIRTTVAWIPGHIGIPENEEAQIDKPYMQRNTPTE